MPTRAEREQDLVDQAGDESFPASDPPSWTLGHEPTLEHVVVVDEPRMVAGVFDDERAAADAVYRLSQQGFDATREVSVLAAHHRARADVPHRFRTGAGRGLAIGVSLGAVLGAVMGLLMAYGVIPNAMFAEGGVLRSTLTGAMAGAFVGFVAGALGGNAVFWTDETAFDATDVHGGAIRVSVHADTEDRAEKALEVLREAGARHFQNA